MRLAIQSIPSPFVARLLESGQTLAESYPVVMVQPPVSGCPACIVRIVGTPVLVLLRDFDVVTS